MPWWEKFSLGQNKKDLQQAGLTSKDLSMISGDAEQPNIVEEENSLWREEESKGKYCLPISHFENAIEVGRLIAAQSNPPTDPGRLYEVCGFLAEDSLESHRNESKQAIDFLVPDGTPVIAAADGIIIEVVISNDQWGPSEEYANFQNRITISHDNGEFTQYIHLAKGSAEEICVPGVGKIFKRVKKGQQIALTGMNGWTTGPHLHFSVFRLLTEEEIMKQKKPNPIKWKSLKPRFVSL